MATKDDNEVRLSHNLSEGEIKATQKRREKVLMCLKNLGIHCDQNNVPNIVVLGSGGGLRAMIALLGTLVELKKQNFLDAVMYLCGVSGSTWCMSLLYGDGKWSENLMYLEKELCKNLSNFSWHIIKAIKSLKESSKDEHYSLTDFWASCLVYQILQQFDENELADHREASETGINPYPIYAAVDKEKLSEEGGNFPGTWFEFTPHEVGYSALGAFVSTKHFGSEFEKGKLKKRGKKKHICYMQGLWGSALGSIEEILRFIRDSLALFPQRRVYSQEGMFSYRLGSNLGIFTVYEAALLLLDLQLCAVSGSDPTEVFKKLLNIWSEDKEKSASYQLCIEMRNTWAMKKKEERMESCAELAKEIEKEFGAFLGEEGTLGGVLLPYREILLGSVQDISEMVLKTIRCALTWKWGTTNNFLYNCPNFQSSYLVKTKLISLIDAGLAINSAYPLVLRAERRTDLIISFDFSSGDPFETIKKTATYCQKNGIPFPKIEDQEMDEKNPSECYIFRGDKSCPTVMHFPLFNNRNCSDKIEEYRKRFPTFSLSFPEGDIKELLEKAGLNVSNNSGKILDEIKRLVSSSHTKEF
ncbi:cytosolic phospholipase A2 gamma isoform X3 [Aquila chrysaetos chrysaetos]|uniref:cytosolic phospholipase A2 gamma isoform X3 n=1 Tax=Aquila chrysaetos chrysaetos TaxID=223781 RepID=UPI001B7D3774|nr:cytosolic phospholipase A2 gamma isoform X3 [Aquila chrysaetos chrysaetos]